MSDPSVDPTPPDQAPQAGWRTLGAEAGVAGAGAGAGVEPETMIPARGRRPTAFERVSMRLLATGGIVGLATAMGAILVAKDVAGWIVGLAVGLVSVILAAILWSSRQL
jgi:hypothetical protein